MLRSSRSRHATLVAAIIAAGLLQTAAALAPLRTDSAGLFQLVLPAPGRYELRASRIGYATIGPTELIAERDRDLEIVLRKSTQALALDPVEVTLRHTARTQLDEVRARIDWERRVGIGRAMTREEIERRAAPTLPALVSTMSPRVRTVAPITGLEVILLPAPGTEYRVCTPVMYIDGIRAADALANNILVPENLEAVELYIGAQAPVQYGGGTCGVVLFWTRRGADADSPFLTWKRAAAAAVVIAVILLFGGT
ncbi:MAG TPA: hypothetical protein VMN60_07980 [Longimicrobiales bacterium]|nr:hypothetical protein [Longimicrobiales bacterium]